MLARLSWVNDSSGTLASLDGARIVAIAEGQLGVRELTGRNDGKDVEAYLRYTGLPKGNPWCAAFVSWVYGKAGFAAPRTAWSPALFPVGKRNRTMRPGMVYGLYDAKKGRIVHCGIGKTAHSDWILGIEGNTNVLGGVDGDGVYLKRRHRSSLYAIADWISKKGGGHAD